MSTVGIDGAVIDIDDPCALYTALYAVKLKLLSGERTEEIEVRSPLTNRRTRFGPSNMPALEAELRSLARACDARNGKRTRFALAGRVTRPY
ncbi:hypothetical protein AncyloWKF20_05180 [Ancylobacter sp. WKF20]|uniref:hypothetical protein n=1 Tax=Ancylobacter sp. WKF20 TaxID=3039801 RepID=UPI0024345806|nr:hypothetical protein [Ancylobacter sp. WKF20]WGD31217.1 hypothetical protein AncyloWKF20_05180 [Ancylobacter sp. WKF20]